MQNEPTNKEIMKALENHINDDLASFQSIRDTIRMQTDEDRIAAIFHKTLTEYFEKKGTSLKTILIGTAMIIGAITVILGGLKAILGWLGFSYLGK